MPRQQEEKQEKKSCVLGAFPERITSTVGGRGGAGGIVLAALKEEICSGTYRARTSFFFSLFQRLNHPPVEGSFLSGFLNGGGMARWGMLFPSSFKCVSEVSRPWVVDH